MLRALAISLVVLLVVLTAGVPGWVAVNRTDLVHPNDGDLGLVAVDPAPGAAGLAAARRAVAASSVAEAERLFEGVQTIDFDGVPEEELTAIHRDLERLVARASSEAEKAAARGRADDAIRHGLFGMKLGRAVARGNNGLLGMMFAVAYQTASLDALETVVRRVKLGAPRARSLALDLEASRWAAEDWFRAWAYEYQAMKKVFSEVDPRTDLQEAAPQGEGAASTAYGVLPASYLWQPNRTLSKTATLYREQRLRSARACAPSTRPKPRPGAEWIRAFGPNAVGNILLEVARPDFDRFERQRCHLEARIALVQTLAAAKAHWERHGQLPGSLTALAPEILPALPIDAFRDAPLHYSAEDRRVWSLGSDFAPGDRTASDPADHREPALSLAFSG